MLAHAFGADQRQNAKRYYRVALMNDAENTHIHYFYALFLRFILKEKSTSEQHLSKSESYLKSASESQNMHIVINGYIEHAKILQKESKFKAARFLLKRVAKLDMTRRMEIKKLLQSIQSDERELSMLNSLN